MSGSGGALEILCSLDACAPMLFSSIFSILPLLDILIEKVAASERVLSTREYIHAHSVGNAPLARLRVRHCTVPTTMPFPAPSFVVTTGLFGWSLPFPSHLPRRPCAQAPCFHDGFVCNSAWDTCCTCVLYLLNSHKLSRSKRPLILPPNPLKRFIVCRPAATREESFPPSNCTSAFRGNPLVCFAPFPVETLCVCPLSALNPFHPTSFNSLPF